MPLPLALLLLAVALLALVLGSYGERIHADPDPVAAASARGQLAIAYGWQVALVNTWRLPLARGETHVGVELYLRVEHPAPGLTLALIDDRNRQHPLDHLVLDVAEEPRHWSTATAHFILPPDRTPAAVKFVAIDQPDHHFYIPTGE